MDKKPFSKQDYIENDHKCKIIASRFLVWDGRFQLEVPISEQPEKYKESDFFIRFKNNGKNLTVETERKIKGWDKKGKWQGWKTLDVPYRKKDSKADIFIMHNKSWDTLAVMMMNAVHMSPVSKKDTKCSNVETKQEKFFNVALDNVRFFKTLSDDRKKWVEISKEGKIITK